MDSIPSPGKSKIMTEIKVRLENLSSRLPQKAPIFQSQCIFFGLQVAKCRPQTLLKKPFVSKDPYVDNVLTW